MKFHMGMEPHEIKEQVHYTVYHAPDSFGRKGRRRRILGDILFAAMLVLGVLMLWWGFNGQVLYFFLLGVLAVALAAFGLALSLAHSQALRAARYRKEREHAIFSGRSCQMDDTGITVEQEDGGYRLFVGWDAFDKAYESPLFYFFLSPMATVAFRKKDLLGHEAELEGYIQAHFVDKEKPVLREKRTASSA